MSNEVNKMIEAYKKAIVDTEAGWRKWQPAKPLIDAEDKALGDLRDYIAAAVANERARVLALVDQYMYQPPGLEYLELEIMGNLRRDIETGKQPVSEEAEGEK